MCPLDGADSPAVAAAEVEDGARRRLLTRLFWSGLGLVSAGIAAPILSYLIRPLFGGPPARVWVRIGKVEDLPLNVPQRLAAARRVVEGWQAVDSQVTAWVARLPDKIYVFDPHCTHLGCAYRWDQQSKEFVCPCHSGVFSLTGKVISGPPPRPLDTYAYEVRDGFLYVDPVPIKQVV